MLPSIKRRCARLALQTNKRHVWARVSFKQQIGDAPPKRTSQIRNMKKQKNQALVVSSGLWPPHAASGPYARRRTRRQLPDHRKKDEGSGGYLTPKHWRQWQLHHGSCHDSQECLEEKVPKVLHRQDEIAEVLHLTLSALHKNNPKKKQRGKPPANPTQEGEEGVLE
jgi:hypothetical protein